MAEGHENDSNTGQNQNQGNVNGLDLNEMNLGLANQESSLSNIVNAYTQEYESLDHTLDEIDTWMNKIEEQNDDLNAQLDDLLQSSKEARRELEEENLKAQLDSGSDNQKDNQAKQSSTGREDTCNSKKTEDCENTNTDS